MYLGISQNDFVSTVNVEGLCLRKKLKKPLTPVLIMLKTLFKMYNFETKFMGENYKIIIIRADTTSELSKYHIHTLVNYQY